MPCHAAPYTGARTRWEAQVWPKDLERITGGVATTLEQLSSAGVTDRIEVERADWPKGSMTSMVTVPAGRRV